MSIDNETWVIEAGDAVLEKRAAKGANALTPLDRLVYCLWVADYGMRNAGDLEAAGDLYDAFQDEGARLARELDLPVSIGAFARPRADLEAVYFDLFDAMCAEIRARAASD